VIKTTIQLKKDKHLSFTDNKKITVSTAKKNGKTYRTYQINIDPNTIKKILFIDDTADNTKINLYLTKKHKQYYMITLEPDKINKSVKTSIKLDTSKTSAPVTLPKNEMDYIKAYDTYLSILDNLNKKFKPEPLKADILTIINAAGGDLQTEINITNIKTNIKNDFIEYIKTENGGILPDWLNTLTTNWTDKYLKEIMNIKH